ncbi:MAG: hypothetical protein CM15mP10_2730 [Actinomycetota bacterium]|nr:MAG: hypothetical protein CM15mP10_2730 [Actinomycetota bacterium]
MSTIIKRFFLLFGFHKSYGRLWVSKRFEKIIWGSFIVLAFYRYFN